MAFRLSKQPFIGDLDIDGSLNAVKSRDLFKRLAGSNLENALKESGVTNPDIALDNARDRVKEAKKTLDIAALGLSDDEAGAISCYTLQCAEGIKSPYEVINQGLAGSRNRATIYPTRKLIYLLLSGLRKLPRFRPSEEPKMFYRGIRIKVPTTKEEANGHQFYVKDKTVTWWGFTSTTTDLGVTQDFIDGAAASTLFNIGGEDLWGYSIKAFSPFPSE